MCMTRRDPHLLSGCLLAATGCMVAAGDVGELSRGISAGTGSADGSTSSGPRGSTSVTGEVTGDDQLKLDLHVPDIGTDPPNEMPTCATLEQFGTTSVGCEFWSVEPPRLMTPGGLGIGVGNPWDLDVTVTFEDSRGVGESLRQVGQIELGPRQSAMVTINGPDGLLAGEVHMLDVGLNPVGAFRVTSDFPITAMQINPVGGAPSVVPEASMLLPTNALNHSYIATDYAGLLTGFVIAVAIEDGTTVTTTQGDVQLDAFDVHVWEAKDITGFFAGADAPIAVFAGNRCTNIPENVPWCDHVEEQMIPLAAWGTRYVGARHPPRRPEVNPTPENVVWKVVAGTDATTITLTPAVSGGDIHLASAGDSFEFATNESFLAESEPDKPFMLVQFMTGADAVGLCTQFPPLPAGDPYMLQMVPIEQWVTSLPFLTDSSYQRDFVFIAREAGSAVDLACLGPIPDDRFVPIAGTVYEVGWVDLDADGGGEGACVDGQQFIEADAPIGVHVGGVGCAASYGYPGGLNLDALWDPPTTPRG